MASQLCVGSEELSVLRALCDWFLPAGRLRRKRSTMCERTEAYLSICVAGAEDFGDLTFLQLQCFLSAALLHAEICALCPSLRKKKSDRVDMTTNAAESLCSLFSPLNKLF